MPQTFTARWIFPADRPPLPGGTITVQGDTIVAVDPAGTRRADEDLGNVAILPGFVNAHTHLDLTGMRGLCPPTADFTAWLRGVVRQQRARDGGANRPGHPRRVGRVSSPWHNPGWRHLQPRPELAHPGKGLAAFRRFPRTARVAGRARRQAHEQAESWLKAHLDSGVCKAGLSPHAPYSVRNDLFVSVADLLAEQDQAGRIVPTAIHLAESREELELLESRQGPMVDFLTELGVWQPDGLVRSPAEVVKTFEQTRGVLFVHGNYLEPPFGTGQSLVYCPRTHAAFGHAPHPFQKFLAQGVPVALGTDSLASNPDLDILAEARFLYRRHADLAGDFVTENADPVRGGGPGLCRRRGQPHGRQISGHGCLGDPLHTSSDM